MILTTAPGDRAAIARAFADATQVSVVCLCAAWCDVCTEFRDCYERIAVRSPHVVFVWLDVEDDSDSVGDIDVDNFPTLAVYRGSTPLHFGVSLPQEQAVARLIDALARGAQPLRAPEAVRALPGALSSRGDSAADG